MHTEADFDIVFDPETSVPMGYARTPLGVDTFGSRPVNMLNLDAEHFWSNLPDGLLVAIVDDTGAVHYPTKNRLQ